MSLVRRVGAHRGLWSLVAVLGLTVLFLLTAAPRTVNRIEDEALRRTLVEAPYTVRDLVFSANIPLWPPWPDAEPLLANLNARLPPALASAVGDRWSAQRSGLLDFDGPQVSRQPRGQPPKVALLHLTGLDAAVRVVEGAPPRNRSDALLEVMVSAPVARTLNLRPGREYRVVSHAGVALPVRVTGLYVMRDAAAPIWAPYPTLQATGLMVEGTAGDPVQRLTATLVTDQAGLSTLQQEPVSWGLVSEVRYRLDERRVDTGDVAPLRAAVARAGTNLPLAGFVVSTGLDDLLAGFLGQATAVRALLAVVAATLAGLVVGLLLLGVGLAVHRRRAELALMRARGASLGRLVARLSAEATLAVLPAVAVGALAGSAVPGRPTRAGDASVPAIAALVLIALVIVLAVPVAAALAHRRVTAGDRGRRAVRARSAPLRRTLEATIVVLAVAGVVVVRRRGIAQAGVDPYLAAVPVLAGAAVGLLVLRGFPLPVWLLGRLAARGRGGVAFLGLARAGRAPVASALALVVLVLAVALGGFAASIQVGLAGARDVAATLVVGGDLRLDAARFAPDAAERVAAVPGVTAVAAGNLVAPGSLRTADGLAIDPGIAVLVVDLDAYRRVLDQAGLPLYLPDAGSGPPDAAVPVLASRVLPRDTEYRVAVDDTTVRVRVAANVDRLPGLSRVDFVVVPREALGGAVARDSLLFVAIRGADPAAVRAAARTVPGARPDDPFGPGGSAGPPGLPGPPGPGEPDGVAMLVRAEQRSALDRSAFNDGITMVFTVAAVAALLAGLLAVGLALMVDAAARGRALSLLRTMGLAPGSARRVLLVEFVPLLVTTLVAGLALGIALPALLAPALGLGAFTAGVPVDGGVDGGFLALLAGLLLLLTAAALLTEEAANRRLGLGQVLRVD
jgi:putative ABC transport system permease protein